MNLKSLEDEAFGLSSQGRARLALDLIESLEALSAPEVERLWEREAQRRAEQVDAGAVALITAEMVSAKAHALLR